MSEISILAKTGLQVVKDWRIKWDQQNKVISKPRKYYCSTDLLTQQRSAIQKYTLPKWVLILKMKCFTTASFPSKVLFLPCLFVYMCVVLIFNNACDFTQVIPILCTSSFSTENQDWSLAHRVWRLSWIHEVPSISPAIEWKHRKWSTWENSIRNFND